MHNLPGTKDRAERGRDTADAVPQFNLLRWFSLLSLLIIATVAIGLGYITTHFLVKESMERDSMLSAQFIQAIAEAEVSHSGVPFLAAMGELLDPREDHRHPAATAIVRKQARQEFIDHIAHLPDALLANIYAMDRIIVWSTNPSLIGKRIGQNPHLEAAFVSGERVVTSDVHAVEGRHEQKFIQHPEKLFIESYIPLKNEQGRVMSVVEIYKEPKDLLARIQRGYVLIWLSSFIGGGLIYGSLFWIVRRASILLASQQQQLIANETFVALGEMSSAVAHSLRNPLATIRSSAELALDIAEPPLQKNIGDIISQVDRMSHWVRGLLLSSRPISGDSEPVDPAAAVRETLAAFEQQLRVARIEVEAPQGPAPAVISERMLLSQVLNSLVANAIEAMPGGGRLSIRIDPDPQAHRLHLIISDSGRGMSPEQETLAFKPFYTTKKGGLGVGLVLVKRIMERFGGKVSLTSREQEGTRVCLSFRLAAGEEKWNTVY